MIENATLRVPELKVNRTRTSRFDTLYGIIGEYCFAQWFFGDWIPHSKVDTKGEIDFIQGIEIKTSAFPFSERLNLLVREDYAFKRKPRFYVQTIIDLPNRSDFTLRPDYKCILAGYATSEDVEKAPVRDFGSKFGGPGGYKCRYISTAELKPIDQLRILLN